MDEISRAAYIISQAVAAYIEAQSMIMANKEREIKVMAFAYDEAAFYDLIDKYGIGTNTVIEYLRD